MHTHKQLKQMLLCSCVLMSLAATAQSSQSKEEIPKFSSDAEKQQWIVTHQDEYNKAGGAIVVADTLNQNVTTPEFSTQAEKDAWLSQQKQVEKAPAEAADKDVPDKEAAISTEAEKDAYMKNRPSIVYMSQEEFNALPSEKQASVLADPNFVITK